MGSGDGREDGGECRPDGEPRFRLSTRDRLVSISSIGTGLRGRLRELDPDDVGEGPFEDETDRRCAGDVAVCRLPLDSVGECALSWPDADGSAERYCESTTKASAAPSS